MSADRIVVCGAGAVGASVAWFLARRGAEPLIVDRARPGAAASGKAAGFLALDWCLGTPLDGLMRASFGLHAEIADELGADRIGYRRTDALMVASADDGDVDGYARLDRPAWLDGNVAVHQVIGDRTTTAQVNPHALTTALVEDAVGRGATLRTGVVEGVDLDPGTGAVTGVIVDGEATPAAVVVLALGPWTSQAQRWMALPQVFGSRGASVVLAADVPGQVVFSEFLTGDGQRTQLEIYPRADGTVYVNGLSEHDSLPEDPDGIAPITASGDELHRRAGVHSTALRDAEIVARGSCYRPLTVDGIPLIGPVPDVPGAYLATAHASWGICNAPATGRMVAEMVLDGASRSLDAAPFALSRLPMGRIAV
ncbi:MAG: FAD-binding oxidoreductase [Actinobacteria bacterium]|nr:FAD-binding oxidoreductase [Actinomycetota bacterium]